MKRAIIVIIVWSAAAALYFYLRQATAADGRDLAARAAAWQNQMEQVEQLQIHQQQIRQHLAEAKQALALQPARSPLDQLKQKVLSGASWRSFTPAEYEQLLAELGLNWNTTGDYVILSKKSLDDIGFGSLYGIKVTSTVIGTLALTDDEQSSINDLAKQISDARIAWDQQHLQRTEPSGNIVAEYSLPVDADFSQSQRAIFTNGIVNILGAQRAGWFQNQSQQWQLDNGLVVSQDFANLPADFLQSLPDSVRTPQPTTMILEANQSGNETQINLTLKQSGNTMNTTISPYQPVPGAFKPLFPGGWQEIAQREGFKLPKSFGQQ